MAGSFARALFGVGMLGAAVLAAAVVPLSTAYSICEFTGQPVGLSAGIRTAPVFYGGYVGVVLIAAGVVLLPGLPLVSVLVLTQVLNAVLLLPLLLLLFRVARDPHVTNGHPVRGALTGFYALVIAGVAGCLVALIVSQVG